MKIKRFVLFLVVSILSLSSLLAMSCGGTNNGFTITFDGNGGELVANSGAIEQTVLDASLIVEPTFVKTGYNWIGWDKVISTITTDTTVTAQWAPISSVNIAIDSNGGEHISDKITLTYNEEITTLPADPVRAGYVFSGWFCIVNNVRESTPIYNGMIFKGVSRVQKILAMWTNGNGANVNTINYDFNGADSTNSFPKSFTEGTALAIDNPTKEGYRFLGWTVSGSENTTPIKNFSIPSTQIGPISLVANWSSKVFFKVSFNLEYNSSNKSLYNNGNTPPNEISVEYGSTLGKNFPSGTLAPATQDFARSSWVFINNNKEIFVDKYTVFNNKTMGDIINLDKIELKAKALNGYNVNFCLEVQKNSSTTLKFKINGLNSYGPLFIPDNSKIENLPQGNIIHLDPSSGVSGVSYEFKYWYVLSGQDKIVVDKNFVFNASNLGSSSKNITLYIETVTFAKPV